MQRIVEQEVSKAIQENTIEVTEKVTKEVTKAVTKEVNMVTAKKLIMADKLSIEEIADITSLPMDVIEELKKEM